MPILHRRQGQGKTVWCIVLSCPCQRCEQNWRQVDTVGDRKFRTVFVQSRNAVRTILKTVLTCHQFCSHHRQDKTRHSCHVSGVNRNSARTTENSLDFLTPLTAQDKTVLSCWWCDLGIMPIAAAGPSYTKTVRSDLTEMFRLANILQILSTTGNVHRPNL